MRSDAQLSAIILRDFFRERDAAEKHLISNVDVSHSIFQLTEIPTSRYVENGIIWIPSICDITNDMKLRKGQNLR